MKYKIIRGRDWIEMPLPRCKFAAYIEQDRLVAKERCAQLNNGDKVSEEVYFERANYPSNQVSANWWVIVEDIEVENEWGVICY